MTREVVAEGDRVHRPAHRWTPTVHALLEHLHAVGFDRVPRPLGIADGRETVSLVPGESGPAPRLHDVAYALEYAAPFRSDETALRWHAFGTPPDRERRIEVFAAEGVEPQRTWAASTDLEEHVRWTEANLRAPVRSPREPG